MQVKVKWQDPTAEVSNFYWDKIFPEHVIWYSWVAEDSVEIRIIKRDPEKGGSWALTQDNKWLFVSNMHFVPPAFIYSTNAAASVGISPLEDKLHVYDPYRDQCLRCKASGQVIKLNIPDYECPGWLDQPEVFTSG